jgi:hypothetical protein
LDAASQLGASFLIVSGGRGRRVEVAGAVVVGAVGSIDCCRHRYFSTQVV